MCSVFGGFLLVYLSESFLGGLFGFFFVNLYNILSLLLITLLKGTNVIKKNSFYRCLLELW